MTEPAPTEPEVTEPEVTEPEQSGVLMVVNTDVLKVRSGPDTTYECVERIIRGTQVLILEEQTTGDLRWGRTELGWVCMDYLCLPGEETPVESTPVEPTTPSEPEKMMGTVNTGLLKVRSGPDTANDCVAILFKGDRIEILEKSVANGMTWGRIEKGWVCLDYVLLDNDEEVTEPTEPEMDFPFRDVPADDWCRESVEYVYSQGYMKGVSDTRFDTEGSMTRAMIVTVLYRLAGEPEVDIAIAEQFTDVKESDYFAKPVAWAKQNGIVMGVSATEFAPNRKVSRQDAITIFRRYYVTYMGRDGQASITLDAFDDANQVADYAYGPVAWAVQEGIIDGDVTPDGLYLTPREDLTRAQAARMMYMLDRLLGKVQ